MITHFKNLALTVLVAGFLAGCAAKPPVVESLASSADPSQEVEATQKMLDQAKSNNLDVLSPKNYERAEDRLIKAREQIIHGKSKEKILQNIAESRGWLREAQNKGEVASTAGKGLSEARSAAIKANAPQYFSREFTLIDNEVRDLARDVEKGDLAKANKMTPALIQRYHDLEVQSVTKTYLSQAQENLKSAKRDQAERFSPKTYRQTDAKINQVLSMISQNPQNTEAIKAAAADATEQSKYLLDVNRKTRAGNSEDLVLQSEKQRRVISGLAEGLASTESELAQKQAALKTADELRRTLNPQEAEVFVEGNAVKVRLKGVQFGANQAKLNKKSTALLQKVDQVLGTVGVSQVMVEGHTDAVGSAQANREISLKRAEAVQNYMISQGRFEPEKVRAIGRGEEEPIGNNKTKRGRSENRRIDLVIEPALSSRVE